nr:class II aldolase/adducin family protein [Marinicella sp. W31]MDC2880241.1 class II aldolase/adducin family protein [Marinicella sp. W31]
MPYRRPGTPLAEAIDAVASQAPDVLFLFNHGIIVTGKTVEETRQRVELVTKAVATPKGDVEMVPDIDGLTQLSKTPRTACQRIRPFTTQR